MSRVLAAALALVFSTAGSVAAAEPSIVRELIPGPGPTLPFIVAVDDDLLYFDPAGVTRAEAGVWGTDGTKHGTRRVYADAREERPECGVAIACLANPDDPGPWMADGRFWHCPGDPIRPKVLPDPGWTVGVHRARVSLRNRHGSWVWS